MFFLCLEKNESSNQTGTKRPTWSIFGKQNQNVETLLFKGKFYDWPGDLKELKPVHDAANNVHRIPSARRVGTSNQQPVCERNRVLFFSHPPLWKH